MLSVVFARVAFAYAESSSSVFVDLDLHFEAGFTGLVGPNGAGKSTLLALIAGHQTPDAGALRLHPKDSVVIMCPQDVDRCDRFVESFAATRDRAHARWRSRLGLETSALGRWATLSPGERKRWQIGAALCREPEILLLDEPTNHLDAMARGLLMNALRDFAGVGVIVSHDRHLLDQLCSKTVWLEHGNVHCYEGGFEAADTARRREREADQAAHARATSQDERLARALAGKRNQRESAAKEIGSRKRMKNTRDSDGRSVNRKARAAKAEAAHARAQKAMTSRKARGSELRQRSRPRKQLGGAVHVEVAPPHAQRLARLVLPELRAGTKQLLGPVHVAVDAKSRIRLAGPNGAGKSTLLAALAERLPPDSTLHLRQELDRDARIEVLDRLRARERAERGRILAFAGRLGLDPKRARSSALPSPGEAKKLALAMALGRGATCLLLDEPTNHLDLPTISRLEDALAEYSGALILVTHDEWFGQRLTDETWTIADGQLV